MNTSQCLLVAANNIPAERSGRKKKIKSRSSLFVYRERKMVGKRSDIVNSQGVMVKCSLKYNFIL